MSRLSAGSGGRSEDGGKVTAWVQILIAVISFFYLVVEGFRFSSPLFPAILTAVFAVAAGSSLAYRFRSASGAPRFLIACSVVLMLIVVGSWVSYLRAADVGPSDVDLPGGGAREPSPTHGEGSDASPSPLCGGGSRAATDRLLYETTSGSRMIVLEDDGVMVASMDAAAFSAAGSWIVHVDVADPSRVKLVDAMTLEVTATTAVQGRITDTTVSNDGETVVLVQDVSGDTRLVLWRPSADEVRVLHDPRADVSGPALTPAGDQLAWVQGEGASSELLEADLETMVATRVAEHGGHPSWSPDGSSLVYSAPFGEGRAIFAVSKVSDKHERLTSPVNATDYDPVVLPACDGVIYARSKDGTVDLWQTLKGEKDMILRDLQGVQTRPAFVGK